jgi:hypothetical protein
MSKRKYSEVEMIGALRQMEAGRSARRWGASWGYPSTPFMPGKPSTEG